ncbi:MAG: aminotransferase class I/II-fold pyridoxal phosphate-dependent enzyme [Candidatus Verstraetearchaeota archaeon]|nr:aminotransferase class I/II-fold pyridoxal phosphate-dependent enzyme [Candidatus Verstraetearchaeota archaeon]
MPQERFDKICPSPVSFLENRGCTPSGVIRFDVAEPDFPPPQAAVEATKQALSSGMFRYTSSWGIPELREALAAFLKSTRQIEYSMDEILVTTGGKFANYAFFASILRPGDSVILIKPFWTSFKAVPEMLGIKAVEVWAVPPYHLDEEVLKSAMNAKPRAIVLNSPNNPTGGVLSESDLRLVRDLAEDHDLLILSDEIDWAYVYGERRFVSPASMDGLRERVVVTDGFSKVFCMTGWRVGFAAGPKTLMDRLHTVQEHAVSSPSTFAQYGCLRALDGYQEYIDRNLAACRRNLDSVLSTLSSTDSIICSEPEGGFYVYPKIDPALCSSQNFCEQLLKREATAVIPGEYFGDNRNHFRLCYAVNPEVLKEGLGRIARFVEGLKNESCLSYSEGAKK